MFFFALIPSYLPPLGVARVLLVTIMNPFRAIQGGADAPISAGRLFSVMISFMLRSSTTLLILLLGMFRSAVHFSEVVNIDVNMMKNL